MLFGFVFFEPSQCEPKVDASHQLRWPDASWWREVGGAGLQVTAKILGHEGLSVVLTTPTSIHWLLGSARTVGAVRAYCLESAAWCRMCVLIIVLWL